MNTQYATFAAGCFWGVEADFRSLQGIRNVTVGYTGGHADNPTYEQVCSHGTGHAEAVLVEFDADVISYERLLDAFFSMHNPTQKNRQGWDIGDNYRSAIFFHSPEQETAARSAIAQRQSKTRKKIVTEVVSATTFWRAEEYHQQYFAKHGISHCRIA